MPLTADTYAAAAERLEKLAESSDSLLDNDTYVDPDDLRIDAQYWAAELRGAAEALAYHQGREYDDGYAQGKADAEISYGDAYEDGHKRGLEENLNDTYNKGFNEGVQSIEPDLARAQNVIWDYLDRYDSPAPHIRERALEDLRGCARDLRIV